MSVLRGSRIASRDDRRPANPALTDGACAGLLWSVRDNVRHAVSTGLRPGRKGTEAAHAKLTEEQVRDIRARCSKDRVTDIARDYNVSQWTISSIKHNRTWKHVTVDAA